MKPIALRRSFVRWYIVVLSGVALLVFLSGATVGADSTVGKLACGGIAAIIGWLMIRISRMGIFLTGETVTFRNYFRTFDFKWDEVDHFEAPLPYGLRRKDGLRAVLRDGRLLAASLYGAGPMNRRGFADREVQLLNDLLHDPNRRAE